jgi:Skp family chaperone for outer membrane proteins
LFAVWRLTGRHFAIHTAGRYGVRGSVLQSIRGGYDMKRGLILSLSIAALSLGLSGQKPENGGTRFHFVSSEKFPAGKNVLAQIPDVGKIHKLGILFDLNKSGIIYADPAIDLTEFILKRKDGKAAESSPELEALKSAFVDSQRFLMESREGKKAIAQIQAAPPAGQKELADRLFGKIQSEAKSIVDAIGARNKLGAVFDLASSGVAYKDPALDITDALIRLYDGPSTSFEVNVGTARIGIVNAQRVLEESAGGKKAISNILIELRATPQEEQERLKERVFKRVQDELFAVLREMATSGGATLVFDLSKSGILYFDPALDITSILISRYDAKK